MPGRAFPPVVIILSLVSCLMAVPASGLEPREIYDRWAPAVVTVTGPRGQGSGFVVPPTGYVVTNFHVVDSQDQLEVVLLSGERRPVTSIVLQDRDRDLAVLSIDPTGLSRVALGDSSRVQIGDRVVAIGAPRGLRHTVTEGIVSQLRSLGGVTLLQTQTPTSPGSSGGPLFNAQGEVIGIMVFKRIDGENLNFAVAVNELRNLLGEPAPALSRVPAPFIPRTRPSPEPQAPLSGYALQLWNGSSVSADTYQERGDSIICERRGGTITVARSSVARIIRHADGSVVQITSAPPSAEQAPAPGPKIDVQDLLARPRSTPTPRPGETSAPPALIVPQETCTGPSEDFSATQWRLLSLNVIRFDQGSRSVVTHVRGLRGTEASDWQAQRLMEEVLRPSRRISVVNPTPRVDAAFDATICADGRDIADHPKLAPFRSQPRATP